MRTTDNDDSGAKSAPGSVIFVGYDEAVKITGLAKPTLYSKVSRREIPHYRLGRRLVRFRVDELLRWLSRNHIPAER